MRKVLAKIALIFLFLLLLNTQGFSSHMLGGELTWVCQGNGSYKFRAGMYLDCNGIGIGSPLFVNSNSPAGQITLNLVQVIELSSAGFFPDGTSPCADCTAGSPGNPTLGLVAYYIFESGDIILNGVPPATGWYFYTGQSTRTPGITNVVGSSLNFAVVAYMYPTSGQSAYPCFDSSPQFESPPVSMVCNSQPYAFHAKASDPEADLLTFEWAEPLVYLNAPLPFAPGYSVNSPFPSPAVSPGSVAATLDTANGLITGISDLSGKFLTSTKVSSYKCGQKVAEVYRDFTYTFTPACSPMINGTTNVPPAISAPFIDPVTGLQTAYSDTVSPGDTVQFILQITDYNFYLNGTPQKVIVTAAGGQFGANFVIPQTGCPNPPCATLTSTVPDTFLIAGAMGFNWITECAHASSPSAGCGGNTTTYHFVAEAHDNYCPANAYSVVPFSITVIGAVISFPLSQTVMCSSDPPLVLNAWPPGGVWSGAVAANVFDPSVAGPGSHTVYYTFTDSSGCISTDQINLTVNVCTGIGEPEFSDGMDVYPNPVIDELMLPELVHPISLLNIFNTQGSKMLQFTEDDRTSYPVTGLASGMYYYEVIFEDGSRGTGKFVKR